MNFSLNSVVITCIYKYIKIYKNINLQKNKMHIAVIGAGASGLAAAKNVLNIKGYTCEVFERNEDIGGTWFYTDDAGIDKYGFPIYACMYSGLKTNLPKEVMGFSDYKFSERDYSYITQEEVLEFLNKYADDFNLRPHINLLTVVKKVHPLPLNRWSLTVMDIPTKTETKKEFDAVFICSGHFNFSQYPDIPGMELFKGFNMHSHEYRRPEPFKDKNVLIVGAGPSGVDISRILADYAKSLVLSYHANNNIPNAFPPQVQLKTDIKKITETGAEFIDGTIINFDCILYCTGYNTQFPYLSDECKIIVAKDKYCIQPLYKHIVNIEFPTMAFIGLPSRSCSLPLYDLQIRYYTEFLKGKMTFPTKEEMYEHSAKDLKYRKEVDGTQRHYHIMSKEFVWDYYKSLADEANIENIWPSITNLRLDSAKQIYGNFMFYQNDRYKIIDKDNYIKL